MAFTGNGRKLVANDSLTYEGTLGTEVTGNGVLAMPVGLHLVTAIGDPSGYPPKTSGLAVQVGRLINVKTGVTITPLAGDKYQPITLTKMCDIKSATLPFTAEEVNTTTQCDDIMTFEVGKTDMQGTMEGVVTIGTTTDQGGLLNNFIDVIKQDGSTSYDVYEAAPRIYFAYFQINKNLNKGDELALFMPINIFGANVGGAMGDAQNFSANFRMASYTGILPGLYRFA